MMARFLPFLAAMGLFVTACATAPTTPSEREELRTDALATLEQLERRDPTLRPTLARAAGYAIFPDVGKGGALVGGAFGRGILFVGDVPMGYVELNQASIGAILGGETFTELIVFETANALQEIEDGEFEVGAHASATALTTGAAAAARFEGGIAVFVVPTGGLMVDVSVNGQQISYQPIESEHRIAK